MKNFMACCVMLVAISGARGPALCQSDGGASRAMEGVNAAAGQNDALAQRPSGQGTQWTPVPPAQVPFGTALRERLATARDKLQSAVDKKAAAVQQGKTGEEIKALDAGIEELRRQVAAVQSEMDLGEVPAQPVTPRPHSRSAPSTDL